MPDPASFDVALSRIMELSYPPTTLKLPPVRAVGHRLAKPVIAKGNQPVRPLALTDGLAVVLADVTATLPGTATAQREDRSAADTLSAPRQGGGGLALTRHLPLDLDDTDDLPSHEPTSGADHPETTADSSINGKVLLNLRPAPDSARREESVQSGQAVAVPVGGEVPRGATMVYPLEWLAGEPVVDLTPHRLAALRTRGSSEAPGEESDGEEDLPALEPSRDWDLPARYASGSAELSLIPHSTPHFMSGIGDWARNKDILLPERTILRPGELALLDALEIDEVEVYRRPVIGIASLAPPFPSPQKQDEPADGHPLGQCPLITLCVELARAARIAALPLGFAPRRFRPLVSAIERWVEQVDILLIVGGTHHGPRCLALDALLGAGSATVAGADLQPGGGISAGLVKERPVLAMPGTLHDVLAGFVLFARPLAHKYLLPTNYSPTVDIVLDCASRINVAQPMALPIRYGWDNERGAFCSRFSGRVHDPWLDYIRGQALVVFQPEAPYADGDIFTGYAY